MKMLIVLAIALSVSACSSWSPFKPSREQVMLERLEKLEFQKETKRKQQQDWACHQNGGVLEYSYWEKVLCVDMTYQDWSL